MSKNKHENYKILNLIGYGLAKFDMAFVQYFGLQTKSAFYQHIVNLNIAETVGTVKNRQDLFDVFFDNGRRGWWQKGDAYIHRKNLIDSLYGTLDVTAFAEEVQFIIATKFDPNSTKKTASPLRKSKYKQLQMTGLEAELFFMHNYRSISVFNAGILEDARLFGDGYDFQVQVSDKYYLTEIKGVRTVSGSIRLTKNEYHKAQAYKEDFGLIIVSNLDNVPKMNTIFDPIQKLDLTEQTVTRQQTTYHSQSMTW